MNLDGVFCCGNCLFSRDGELDGEADIWVSVSAGSSEALRLRPEDMAEGEEWPGTVRR